MAKQLVACEAKCRACHEAFRQPAVIDSSYGEIVLGSPDGSSYVVASALGPFPERVRDLLPSNKQIHLWKVLAALADQGPSGRYTTTMHCPHCQSTDLEFWNGRDAGVALVPEATYSEFEALDDEELTRQIALLT